ncbi:MAG: prolyl oligopeptidase family serine peptidase [Isosphaeraceae bacterium]
MLLILRQSLILSGVAVLAGVWSYPATGCADEGVGLRPSVTTRGVYGGVPTQILDRGHLLDDYGINAVWMGSGSLSRERVAVLKDEGAQVYAEFNTMHDVSYLKDHPDAAPVGVDGKPCPPAADWQGICPTHPGYREARMAAFRKALTDYEIDGIWLDYHHAHASWERAEPILPETCFCKRCLAQFEQEAGVDLPDQATSELAKLLLGAKHDDWVRWRCGVFTDWVRQFRSIRDDVRPKALLGSFVCPWTEEEYDGALRAKLAIDLKAQAEFLDVFSPMPYHVRFGYEDDPAWISRQVAWLGKHLGIEGKPGDRLKIWPIVQLSDWGLPVSAQQVETVVDHGSRPPATGLTIYSWDGLAKSPEKLERLGNAYCALRPVAQGVGRNGLPAAIAPAFQPPARFANDLGPYTSPLRFDDGRPVRDAADWQKRRQEILKTWHSAMGAWPTLIEHPEIEVLGSERRENVTQHQVRLPVASDRTVNGYLLVPDGKGPFPAALVVFYEPETAIGRGKEGRDFAWQLARRGFVTLSIGFDPRVIDTGKSEIKIQPLSYLAYVAANAYNALASRPEVDPKRVGVLGHSYGGKWAMFAACLYDKFACGVWSDPGVAFDEARGNVNYWEPWYLGWDPDQTRKPGLISKERPRLGAYKQLFESGHDLHELQALMAPRPFLVSGGAEDTPKRWQALNHVVAVNRFLGVEDRVAMTNRPAHSPTAQSNEQIYLFLESVLKPKSKPED